MKNIRVFEDVAGAGSPASMGPGLPKPNPEAVKQMDELIANIKSGFCVPTYVSGTRLRVECKDKTYFEINHFKKLG